MVTMVSGKALRTTPLTAHVYQVLLSGNYARSTLTFNLTQFVKNTRYIKGLNLSFTGRNLFLWKPKNNPWTDPEFSDTAGNAIGVTMLTRFRAREFMVPILK
jgi:hypothetical protein